MRTSKNEFKCNKNFLETRPFLFTKWIDIELTGIDNIDKKNMRFLDLYQDEEEINTNGSSVLKKRKQLLDITALDKLLNKKRLIGTH